MQADTSEQFINGLKESLWKCITVNEQGNISTLKPAQDWWCIPWLMSPHIVRTNQKVVFTFAIWKKLSLYMNQSEGSFWTKSLWQEITTENARKKYMKSVRIYKEEQSTIEGPGWWLEQGWKLILQHSLMNATSRELFQCWGTLQLKGLLKYVLYLLLIGHYVTDVS